MARPTKSKDVKGKATESEGNEPQSAPKEGPNLMSTIIMAVIIILCTTISSAASVYFLAPIVLKPLLAQSQVKGEGDAGGGDAADEGDGEKEPTIGPVLDLEEFTVNLKDPGGQHFLRADLSITVTADDPKFEKLTGEAMTKWEEDFKHEMSHYVPAIRDIVITSLTKRTSSELESAEGKDTIKNEIKNQVDGLMQGKHKVIRVNFENFIIQ